jgi:hypothetical protein
MSVPTKGEAFAVLIEHLRLAQENAATLSHLANDRQLAISWLKVSDLLRKVQHTVTSLAIKG